MAGGRQHNVWLRHMGLASRAPSSRHRCANGAAGARFRDGGFGAVPPGEPLQSWKLAAAALVMGGLAIGLLWPRFVRVR